MCSTRTAPPPTRCCTATSCHNPPPTPCPPSNHPTPVPTTPPLYRVDVLLGWPACQRLGNLAVKQLLHLLVRVRVWQQQERAQRGRVEPGGWWAWRSRWRTGKGACCAQHVKRKFPIRYPTCGFGERKQPALPKPGQRTGSQS